MPDLVSTADYIDSACNRRQYHRWAKDLVMSGGAGQDWSQWLAPGRPEAGVAPTTAAVLGKFAFDGVVLQAFDHAVELTHDPRLLGLRG